MNSSTGTAIDADTKFCVTHYFRDRSGTAAHEFMQDCAERIVGRPRITRTRIGRHLYLLGRNNFLPRRHRHHESAECFDINALGKGNRPLPCTLAQKQILVVYTEQLTCLKRRAAYGAPTCAGWENIHKRQLIDAGAFNLSLILRQLLRAGTPRE